MSSITLPTHTHPAKPKSITGFSLVELSIVLVILGR
ncbi:MAG: prepilin-type N-terminal cleavage/methylation domain-containing protein [Rickettsiales bacterium]